MLRHLAGCAISTPLYDASTFDTDPFEPQPDGVGTIFPFFMASGEKGQGTDYVELPYTLAQDSTVFLLLRETSTAIWERKLEWIAEHGGMALLVTHPDYMNFEQDDRANGFIPHLYEAFLHQAAARYRGQFWHAVPREVATFFKRAYTGRKKPGPRRRVCMLSYSHYESDNRIIRYATSLQERGDLVDVIALNHEGCYPRNEILNGVHISRIQNRTRNEKGRFSYFFRVFRFLCSSSAHLCWRQRYQPYDLIHVHNVPDFLVFAAWYPKLRGTRLILDLHDILPEFFASKFRAKENGGIVRLLRFVEKASAAFADHVIISNHLWFEKLVSRSVARSKCSVFINYVGLPLSRPDPGSGSPEIPIVLYPGGLQWHQGLDIAIRAFSRVVDCVPRAEFHIHGSGPEQTALVQLVHHLGLEGSVRFFPTRPHRDIPDLMATASAGVVAKRADSFGNEAYSTKIMEFMSQGVPVLVSRTKIDSYYFDDSVVRFFESGDEASLAKGLIDVLTNPKVRPGADREWPSLRGAQ